MSAYLFVHFKEKTSPDGEQVYFGISRDGFRWEEVNGGQPVLWAYYGDKGVRDHTITYCKHTGKYVILATDLSLSYGMRSVYDHSWTNIRMHGSKQLSKWESEDLVNWSEQTLVKMADEDYGCVWAPDIIYDAAEDDYMVHWSSTNIKDGYKEHGIYYSKTRDFESFTKPKLLFERPDGIGVIDSAIYEDNGRYYMFIKSSREPGVYDACEGSVEELNKVLTPEMKTIEDICDFLGKDKSGSIKAVAYRLETDDSLCIVFIRGDIEVNETKLRNYLKSEVYPAEELDKDGIVAGFIGPKGLPEKVRTVFDISLKTRQSYVCGANEENYHYTGLNIARDLGEVQFVDVKLGLAEGDCRLNTVKIRNPLGEDTSVMRTTLVPSMLNALSLNMNRGNAQARLMEVSPVFLPKGEGELPEERQSLIIVDMLEKGGK